MDIPETVTSTVPNLAKNSRSKTMDTLLQGWTLALKLLHKMPKLVYFVPECHYPSDLKVYWEHSKALLKPVSFKSRERAAILRLGFNSHF